MTSCRGQNLPERRVGRALALGVLLVLFGAARGLCAVQSQNVAAVGTLQVWNGGDFPTSDPAFSGINFFSVSQTNLSLANLEPGGLCGAAGCDTVLLNVASPSWVGGLSCNVTHVLTDQQKADLNSFVAAGGKLLIYDSECVPQDYSWLPYPFSTANPGAYGATGTVHIVEENVLSSSNPASPYYINSSALGQYTDAIGDMNVMLTYDSNWCLDMSGTNVINATGPTHTYARYGSGLIIYNGMDVDYLTTYTPPVATTGAGNLAKVWLQELKTPFNPTPQAALPCGVHVTGITASPKTAENNLAAGDTQHAVTAAITDLTGAGQPGVAVTFEIVSGPNAGASATGVTDTAGNAYLTYTSNGTVGTDTIRTCFTNQVNQVLCDQVTKDWVYRAASPCDLVPDGQIDRNDIAIIAAGRGRPAAPGDPADVNGDGWISINDIRLCTLQCTHPNCVP